MADEPADPGISPEPGEDEKTESDHGPTTDTSPRSRLTLRLAVGGVALCALIALDVFFMMRAPKQEEAALVKSAPKAPGEPAKPSAPAAAKPTIENAPGPLAPPEREAPLPEFDADDVDDEPAPAKPRPPKHFATVHEASIGSCSTASVDGLSRQIVEQTRCISPRAFAPLPSRPNLVMDAHVFPYLEVGARDRLVRVLDANRNTVMTLNSALRTVAQQYLTWRWGAGKRCGVQLATAPGDSNHETGLAIDIAEQSRWRRALEAADFRWLGSSDKVHFDYAGNRAAPPRNMDVLAFQQLWNKNHPEDPIKADGKYTPATEQRLKKSPPNGFAIAPNCGKSRKKR